MSYTVLYREFRPKNFSEIVGQDNTVSILKNQIKKDKISHAYLFSGIRGTGKTSTAKVFAKSICCLDSKDGEACGVCASCRDIQEGSASDIIEIDAASNRGINEIRELKENVGYMPSFGRYRVYIIDEVHMLTPEAFNALLKTLEEPPEHVVFIFATTEANRILPTILSRCQRFDFQRIDSATVVSHMENILEKKSIAYEKRALELIAVNTEGALRDALSLLDKAIAVSSNDTVTEENVNEILGLIGDRDIQLLADAVLDRDVNRAVTTLDEVMSKGREPSSVLSQLIEYYSDKVIAQNVSEPEKIINKSSEYIDSLTKSHCSSSDSRRISDMIYSLSKLKNDMRFFSDTGRILTARIINLCIEESPTDDEKRPARKPAAGSAGIELINDRITALEREVSSLRELASRIEDLEKRKSAEIRPAGSASPKAEIKPAVKKRRAAVRPSSGIISVNRDEVSKIEEEYPLIIQYMRNRGEKFMAEIASRFKPVSLKDNVLTVYPADSLDMLDIFRRNGGDGIFREAISARLKENYDVEYIESKTVLRYSKGGSRAPETYDAADVVKEQKAEAVAADDEYLKSLEAELPEEEPGTKEPSEAEDFDDNIRKTFLVAE